MQISDFCATLCGNSDFPNYKNRCNAIERRRRSNAEICTQPLLLNGIILNKMKIKLLTHVTRVFCALQIPSCADQTKRNRD